MQRFSSIFLILPFFYTQVETLFHFSRTLLIRAIISRHSIIFPLSQPPPHQFSSGPLLMTCLLSVTRASLLNLLMSGPLHRV